MVKCKKKLVKTNYFFHSSDLRYYFQVTASRSIYGGISIQLNAKMYNSTLNGVASSMIKTEQQQIWIQSTAIPEATV